MTEHESPGYDAAALDELLDRAMGGILTKLEAGFDPQAGLANIYARSGAGAHASQPGTPTDLAAEPAQTAADMSARLQEICDHIDMLDAWLVAVTRSAQAAPFGGAAFLEMARPSLRQLRMGLANRTLARNEAERLVDEVQHHLDQADRILRSQHASTLDDTMRERSSPATSGSSFPSQMQVLREMITRLYADAGRDLSLVPAP
jgi:hypothetical protein